MKCFQFDEHLQAYKTVIYKGLVDQSPAKTIQSQLSKIMAIRHMFNGYTIQRILDWDLTTVLSATVELYVYQTYDQGKYTEGKYLIETQ